MVVDLLVEDLEKWFPRSLTQHVRITIIQSAAHILNTYDAKISDCKPQSLSLSLFPLRQCFVLLTNPHTRDTRCREEIRSR